MFRHVVERIVDCCSQESGNESGRGWPWTHPLRWRHNGRDSVSHHQPHDCLLNRLFRHRSKKTSKLRVTGLCAGNLPGPVNSPHKWPVTRKMFPLDDVIISTNIIWDRCWWPGDGISICVACVDDQDSGWVICLNVLGNSQPLLEVFVLCRQR